MPTDKTLRAYRKRDYLAKGIRTISIGEAKRFYPHRFTMEHVPDWSSEPMGNGMFYAPQYRSDKEWYDNTKFPGEGMFIRSSNCISENLSWPLGRMLDKPYTINDKRNN